jgi:cell division protein FtsW
MELLKYIKGDKVIWMVILLLSVISILAVYSSSGSLAFANRGGNTSYYLIKQLILLMIGLFIIFSVHLIPYRFYSKLSQIFLYIAIPLLVVTLFTGESINQAKRWVSLPGTGFTIQPSDFGKLALIMYVARILSLKQDKINDYKEAFQPILIPVILVCALIMPANLSTSLILFLTTIILMFIGRIPVKFIAIFLIGGLIILSSFIAVSLAVNKEGRISTWKNRIEAYMSDEENADNYQVNRAKIAIVDGGLIGKGPGNSVQKNYLPQAYSDFIFAIIIEEYGLFGGLIVLLLYLWLLFRAGAIIKKSTRSFAAFLAVGLTLGLVIQAMVNMAVAVNLFPVTGQTLPLISMGGSSILFTSAAIGMILSVSWGIEKEEANLKKGEEAKEDE